MEEGAKSDTSKSKLPSGGEAVEGRHEGNDKTKESVHTFSILWWGKKKWHRGCRHLRFSFPSLRRSPPHNQDMPNGRPPSNFQPGFSPLQSENHITASTPTDLTHDEAARSTLSEPQKCHYSAPRSRDVPARKNNQRSADPSIRQAGEKLG